MASNLLILDASSLHRCGPYGFISRWTFRADCAMCMKRRHERARMRRESAARRKVWKDSLARAAYKWGGAAGIIRGGSST